MKSINGYILNNLVITADNVEERTRVLKLLEKGSDIKWFDGDKPTEYEELSDKSLSIKIDNFVIDSAGNIDFYKQHYPSYTFITAKQFLGEDKIMLDSNNCLELFKRARLALKELQEPTLMYNYPIINKQNKIMNIKNAFKSKENKAMEYFGSGSTCDINERGLQEFLSYLWETADKETKKEFLKKIVEEYENETK